MKRNLLKCSRGPSIQCVRWSGEGGEGSHDKSVRVRTGEEGERGGECKLGEYARIVYFPFSNIFSIKKKNEND